MTNYGNKFEHKQNSRNKKWPHAIRPAKHRQLKTSVLKTNRQATTELIDRPSNLNFSC